MPTEGQVTKTGWRYALGFATLVAVTPPVSAQTRTLDPSDYGRWERLGGFELDPTGRWLVASVSRTDGSRELRLSLGDGTGEPVILEHASGPVFSADGRWLAYRKGVSVEEQERARESRERIEDRLGLVDLETVRDSVRFDVRAFSFRDDGTWLAALGAPASDSVGADLVVMNPSTGARTLIGNVGSFAWRDGAGPLAATLRTAWGDANGVVLFDPDAGTLRTLESGDADYEALTWRADAAALAVLRSREDESREEPTHDVLLWSDPADGAPPRVLEAAARPELGLDLRVTPFAGVDFSSNGGTVFFGVRPWEASDASSAGGGDGEAAGSGEAPESDDAAVASGDDVDPADVQVWHWNDDRILRAQEYSADRLARRTLQAAWSLDDDRVVVLADDVEEPVEIVAGGRWGLVADLDPYLFERRFGAGTADWYRVDVRTGERTLIGEALEFGVEAHEDLSRILVYDDGWTAVTLDDLARTPIGEGRSFTRSLDDYDYPGPRPSWGVGAWLDGGDGALLYDAHDVWRADLRSGALERVTRGAEADERVRVVNLDPDATFFETPLLDGDDDLVVSVFDRHTKASGYAGVGADGRERWRSVRDALVGGLAKASDADVFAWRSERWDDSPDVFVGGPRLDDARQVTETNPFQADFAWGRAELLDYTTDTGHDLQAILVYPADFQEGRQYPLILYQYERLSDGLHRYDPPSERDYYNYQAWSQAGYFVLMPDIAYEPGRPGPSALDAVEHALDAAVATGHVDPDAMGLIGHSWGGYQASYLPTRTDRFAASVAGAAITNFMSFMGAVHWNGGLPETGHWETGQARMAAPYWEDVEGHLESSPANFIMDLNTPMLLMHGDADGVVDFYQGMEFYNYARRAGKEVVLLVYPGADHGLSDESQQVDYHRRILQWFGHWLKGEPPAPWITDGESWVERERRIGG
jgi:dipeptidyl aminopeptidase/acylaminoacyl peptidase